MTTPVVSAHAATVGRFDDVATVLAPKRSGTTTGSLGHRIDPKTDRQLGPAEAETG